MSSALFSRSSVSRPMRPSGLIAAVALVVCAGAPAAAEDASVILIEGEAQHMTMLYAGAYPVEMAAGMEEQSAKDYNRMANECSQNADSQSKQLFEELVADEERHFDQYDTELENLSRFGKDYLALQSIERSKTRGANMPAD